MSHSPALPTDILYRFGEFVADPVIGRLHRGASEVHLTRKTFEVLVALLRHSDRIVEKDELFRLIWPNTVVEDNNLARCVSMLRKALRDGEPSSEFVVTFPGRGYQFGVPVERVRRADLDQPGGAGEPLGDPRAASAAGGFPVHARRARWLQPLAAVGITSMAVVALTWLFASPGAASDGERRLQQLTSASGLEVEPTWSPDGRFVAYSSNRSGNFDIWVQPVMGGNPIRITSSDASESQPAWSPDGRQIAFRSEQDGGGLYVVPAFGGAPRRVTDFGQLPMWSPDGSTLVFYLARRPLENRAFVTTLDGRPPREILANVLRGLDSFRLAWHPDGRRISILGWDAEREWTFVSASIDGSLVTESAIAPAVGERLRRLDLQLDRFTWAPDGRSLLLEGRSQQAQNVYRIAVRPATLEWTSGPVPLTTSTNRLTDIAVSADGRRLAFSSRVMRTRLWAFPFDPGHRHVSATGVPLTPDGNDATNFDVSNDGQRLAYWTERNGREELSVTTLGDRRDELKAVEEAGSQLRWSPDDAQVAYARRAATPREQPAVVFASIDGLRPQPVDSKGPIAVLDWLSPQSMLMSCPSGAAVAICSMPLAPSGASRLTVMASDASRSLFQGRVSPDHRWISFIARADASKSTVYLMPATGGTWIALSDDGHSYADKPRWSPDASTVYFLSDRSGGLNVWARRINGETGQPSGASFQVTDFQTPDRTIPERMGSLQIAVTNDRLILPVTNVSGAVWVLDNVDR
jgi:Tol biopolymer transport system component/DNA-binding winged helix-turn-helix (wHTH) protein